MDTYEILNIAENMCEMSNLSRISMRYLELLFCNTDLVKYIYKSL